MYIINYEDNDMIHILCTGHLLRGLSYTVSIPFTW